MKANMGQAITLIKERSHDDRALNDFFYSKTCSHVLWHHFQPIKKLQLKSQILMKRQRIHCLFTAVYTFPNSDTFLGLSGSLAGIICEIGSRMPEQTCVTDPTQLHVQTPVD